jgi:peroxiredoxin
VIVFYRGGWCPYCNLTLRTYERDLVPQLSARSASLVAISPETPDASLSTQEKAELTYAVLSDTGARLADALGITFDPSEEGLAAQRALGVDIRTTRADGGTRLPMPSVLIVDPEHVVRFVDIHPDYTGRTEVREILAALQTLSNSGPVTGGADARNLRH